MMVIFRTFLPANSIRPSCARFFFNAIFLGLSVLLIVRFSTAQDQKRPEESPPSLDEIIQNVRAKTKPLDRAVVHLSPHTGAGDGGGRLYWKRGAFVRSNSFRIGPHGEVDVYDTVSNQNATSFLFHTNKTKGTSFSFSLRMPYDTTSETGYGLSDYFLLEYVANQRFDVKYGGRLMSLQLFPKQLKTFGERYDISYVEKDGTRYIRLRRTKTIVKTFYFSESIYIRPDTWQVERLVYEDTRRWHRIQATSYQDVHGVTLPEQVRVVSPQFARPLPYQLNYDVRSGDELDSDPETPSWLDDPALPEVSSVNTREIHADLKKEVDRGLYKKLMQAAIRYRHMLFPSHFHPDEFQTSVDLARRTHPDSRLLKAYKDSVASATKITEDQMYVTTFPSMESNVILPYMNYAAAYRSMRAGYYEKMTNYLDPIRGTYPYDQIIDRLKVHSTLQQTSSSDAFLSLLQNLSAETPLRTTRTFVPALFRKLKRNEKWIKKVKKHAENHPEPLFHLLLARIYQGNENFSLANRHIREISDIRSLKSDMISYLRRAGFRAEFLIEQFSDQITFTALLIRLALKHVQEGHVEKGVSTAKRLLSLLKNVESHVVGSMNVGNASVDQSMSTLVSLFERLSENGHRSLVRNLLHEFMKLYRMPWDRDALMNLLKRTYTKPRALYQIAANYVLVGRTDLVEEFLPPDRFRHLLLDHVRGDDVNKTDHVVLARTISQNFLSSDEQIRKGINVLTRAKNRFPEYGRNRPFILNGLGDAYFQLKNYAKARNTYQALLTHIRRTKHPKFYAGMFRSVPGDRVTSAYLGADPSVKLSDPIIVKLAYALERSDPSSATRHRTIWSFVRLHATGTTPALAFLISGRRDLALRHLLFRFRQTKNRARSKLLMNTLVDVFTEEERYSEASLIFDMAIREKKIQDQKVKDRYERVREKISQSKLIDELREQNFGSPSPKARAAVNRMLRQIERADKQKQTMKYVSKLLNSRANVVPVLLEKTDASSDKVRTHVRKILETIRMRQIYRTLFDFASERSIGSRSSREKSGQK